MSPDLSTERVWNDFGGRLRRFIAARVRDPHDAADVLQETFARVHEKLGTLRDEERINGWLFQIARNAISDYTRSTKRDHAALSTEPAADAEDGSVDDVVASWLPAMIDALPDNFREPVRLFELRDKPQAEIASELGLTLSATKSRVQRGRAMLKDTLLACCAFETDRRGGVLDYAPGERCRNACCHDSEQSC